jgi:DNA-binding winged helix-turn-helix (wHTH) protein
MNYRFGPFTLDTGRGELRKDGRFIKLHPQPVQLLVLLVQRSGAVVTREEIQHALWSSETHVDFELGINSCIRQIRATLEDDVDRPRFVETVPRKGYRFIGTVEEKSHESISLSRFRWVAIAALLVFLVASWFFFFGSGTDSPVPRNTIETSFAGLEQDPALSPDGKTLAFVWNGREDGRFHLYVKLIGGDRPLQLTVAAADDHSPTWSPEGAEIAFRRKWADLEGDEIIIIPALGGSERVVARARTVREKQLQPRVGLVS